MNIDLNYLLSLWENIYVKVTVVYVLYLIFVIYILYPVSKKIFVPLINKTKTNLDNIIYGKVKNLLKILFLLLGLNLVYKLFISSVINFNLIQVAYNILLTIEWVIVYLIFQRINLVVIKHFSKRFSQVLTKNIANFIKILLDIILASVIALLILNAWNINITPLLASAGIVGFAVAMASKSIIENFLSGLILFADKSINVGDTIILSDETVATVEEINIRTTRLKTFDGNVVIIPNSQLLNEKIINKSLSDISNQKRVQVTVGISYGDDVEKAKNLIKQYLLELEGADESSLAVYVDELADWSVNITGKIMVDAQNRSYLLEKQIMEKIYKGFPKNGLSFPFPTYQLAEGKLEIKNLDFNK